MSSSADASVRSRFATPPSPCPPARRRPRHHIEDGSRVGAPPEDFCSQRGQHLFAARSSVRKASSRAARSVEEGATTSRNARISSCNFCSGDAALLTGLNSDCGAGDASTLMTFSAVVWTSRRAFFCGCSDALRRRQCVPGLSPSQSSKPSNPSRYFLVCSRSQRLVEGGLVLRGRSERRSALAPRELAEALDLQALRVRFNFRGGACPSFLLLDGRSRRRRTSAAIRGVLSHCRWRL